MFDRYAKAIVGALVAAAGTWGTAISDGSITATEWSAIVVTALLSLGVIWGVPNTDISNTSTQEYTSVSTSHPVESIQMTTRTEADVLTPAEQDKINANRSDVPKSVQLRAPLGYIPDGEDRFA